MLLNDVKAAFYTLLSSTGREPAGLVIAFTLAISTVWQSAISSCSRSWRCHHVARTGVAYRLLPVAIFLFGIGNGQAIFMVVVALSFHMVLATLQQVDGANRNLISVARTMGASKQQIYTRVVIPAILPDLFMVLRMNLNAAWMVVLIAEATGAAMGSDVEKPLLDTMLQRAKSSGVHSVICDGEVIYADGRFTKVKRDAALRVLHDDLKRRCRMTRWSAASCRRRCCRM
jgi:hypothetical protein